MSLSSGKILVSVWEKAACVKIIGKVNFTSSIDFKTLFDELWRKGYNCFALDLSECTLMDSTFLGVLAGYGLKVNAPQPDKIQRTLELFNPSERVAELLENLGVLHLFNVTQGTITLPEQTAAQDLAPASPSREEVQRTCLEAHELLMQINPANVAKFKDVATFLAEDLKKLKAGA
jgi:anti-sigma B factor antagonist